MISILSTEHGRLRRKQRDIRKRKFAKAIRHGTRERAWMGRWKLQHDGIIFIVDKDMTKEVTAYPKPLALAPVEANDQILHGRTKELLTRRAQLCTSHTVLVVDNSGSMARKDIPMHKTRQVAAYSVTAMDLVAEQLFKQTATNLDVVTLIEFDRNAREIFSQELFDWILYNKILDRRDSRGYKARQGLSLQDIVNGDTNYVNGAPTDAMSLGITPAAAKRCMVAKMAAIAERYGDKLNLMTVGFGSAQQDFSVLEEMAGAVRATNNGAKAEFMYCDKAANMIESAISSLVSSTTMTRTLLMTASRSSNRARRSVELESSKVIGKLRGISFQFETILFLTNARKSLFQ